MDYVIISRFLLCSLVCFQLLLFMVKCVSPPRQPLAPALYVFGDSLFDSGNNNYLPTIARANFLPYGIDFVGGSSTGRFSNGRHVMDFIAEYLRLPYPPPYLSVRKSDIITGLNFASGSCGILPETGSPYGKCLTLDEQVTLFKTTALNDLAKHFNESNGFSKYLSKSIFAFSIGSNDYINNYLTPDLFETSHLYAPQAFSELLVENLSHHLQRLVTLGARKFVVFEIGPIGCIPFFARKSKHSELCVEESNKLVSYFNIKLQEMLKNMTSTLPGSFFVLGHANWLGYDAVMNPSKYGLSDSRNPCCTAWENGTSECIPLLRSCSNVKSHFFWDGYHQTETVYSLIATLCFNGTSVCTPLNVEDLARM